MMSYEMRPSKTVTRRIFLELLRHLKPIASPLDYHYVGFGALEFIDFDLVHRQLGITRMTSIECDGKGIERYKWNRPFSGIEVLAGRASTVLSAIDLSGRSIVWLDYTETLRTEIIGDVENVARILVPGSVLAVTLNAHPARLNERMEALESAVGAERVPLGVTDSRLGQWGLAEVQYKILSSIIQSSFSARADGAKWLQLLNINYQDNAKMQMVAGLVGESAEDSILTICRFSDLSEIREGEEALMIRVPLLTSRERDWINQRTPIIETDKENPPGISEKDLIAYKQIYRWLDASV